MPDETNIGDTETLFKSSSSLASKENKEANSEDSERGFTPLLGNRKQSWTQERYSGQKRSENQTSVRREILSLEDCLETMEQICLGNGINFDEEIGLARKSCEDQERELDGAFVHEWFRPLIKVAQEQ